MHEENLLHYAAKWGDVETIHRLMATGRGVRSSALGRIPLEWASLSQRAGVEVIDLLLELGSPPQPALYEASCPEKTKRLLQAGARPVAGVGYGTPDEAQWRLLIESGADPSYPRTLESAASVGNAELVRFLLDCGVSPDLAGWNDLHLAVMIGSVEDVRRILARGLKAQGRSSRSTNADPWTMALRLGDLDKLEAMVEGGADPFKINPEDETALFTAAETDHPEVIRWLVGLGVPADWPAGSEGATALCVASEKGTIGAAQALIEAGSPVDTGTTPPLWWAANIEIVRLLMANGATLRNSLGDGLIVRAVEEADDAFAREVIEMVDDLGSDHYWRAMPAAVQEDERNIVRMLLEKGSDPNAFYDDWTSLFYARSPEVAQMLLNAGADPQARDYCTGSTRPLDQISEPEVRAVIEAAISS